MPEVRPNRATDLSIPRIRLSGYRLARIEVLIPVPQPVSRIQGPGQGSTVWARVRKASTE